MTQAVTNWFGNIDLEAGTVVEATSAEQIAEVVRDHERYPTPVRAGGSHHSTTQCGVVDGGTLVLMRRMDRILHIGEDTVTVQAGALYIDVAQALREHGMQFYVNVEIGNLTMGSAACGGTKDASMPGEYGQVSSYAVGVKLVTSSGDVLDVTDEQPELLQAVRSSYGLFGIVYEVTFRIRPMLPMSLHHEAYELDSFTKRLASLRSRDEAMMLYIDPYNDVIVVEFRRYIPHGFAREGSTWQWRLRNFVWSKAAPYVSYQLTTRVRSRALRYRLVDVFYKIVLLFVARFLHGGHTYATDQMIRYPEVSDESRYTFSIWAFPEARYAQILRDYYAWLHEYTTSTGFRPDMIHVGYRIAEDQQALFSYSFDGPVMTIDPVSSGNPGWDEFLVAYNAFCSEHGGVPLFNQTHLITRQQVDKAFVGRVAQFAEQRERHDPDGRFLTAYFRERLT
ncbi:MAG: FAD-binding oxidoreductase [Egibacteraceae bacterium]